MSKITQQQVNGFAVDAWTMQEPLRQNMILHVFRSTTISILQSPALLTIPKT